MLKRTPKHEKRTARRRRIRSQISGTATRPRIASFRSLKSFSLQAINDETGTTLAQARLPETGKKPENTVAGAGKVGTLLAERLRGLGIEEAVFDRGGYLYHGKVKAAAEALRASGIKL
jgi:large subunit ribosomal protein L18